MLLGNLLIAVVGLVLFKKGRGQEPVGLGQFGCRIIGRCFGSFRKLWRGRWDTNRWFRDMGDQILQDGHDRRPGNEIAPSLGPKFGSIQRIIRDTLCIDFRPVFLKLCEKRLHFQCECELNCGVAR